MPATVTGGFRGEGGFDSRKAPKRLSLVASIHSSPMSSPIPSPVASSSSGSPTVALTNITNAANQETNNTNTIKGPRPLSLTLTNRNMTNGNGLVLSSPGPATAPLACFSTLSASSKGSPTLNGSGRRPFSGNGPRRQSSISYRRSEPFGSGEGVVGAGRVGNVSVGEAQGNRTRMGPRRGTSMSVSFARGTPAWIGGVSVEEGAKGDVETRTVLEPLGDSVTESSLEEPSDLLRTIAQKESLCLELRSQLALHEAELLNLKRKWEAAVARGLPAGASPLLSPSPGSSASYLPMLSVGKQTVVLEGIKEGVQGVGRFLAGLGELPPPLPSPQPQPKAKSKAQAKAKRESMSSVSTSGTSGSSSLRSSQSSITTSSSSDEPRSSLSEVEHEDVFPASPAPQGLPPTDAPSSFTRTAVHRRTAKSKSISVPNYNYPGNTPTTPLSATPFVTSPLSPSSSSTLSTSGSAQRIRSQAPTPVAIPGMSVSALASRTAALPPLPPISALVGSAAKHLEHLHARAGRRASGLFADMGSLLAGSVSLTSPTTSVGSMTMSPLSHLNEAAADISASLLDDDDGVHDLLSTSGTLEGPMSAMATLQPVPVSPAAPQHTTQPAIAPFDDDWNW